MATQRRLNCGGKPESCEARAKAVEESRRSVGLDDKPDEHVLQKMVWVETDLISLLVNLNISPHDWKQGLAAKKLQMQGGGQAQA